MKFVPTPMSARPSYAEAWQITKAIRPCGAGFVGAIAWTSTRSMEANYSTRGLRMDDDPVPKVLINAMDDLDDFQTVVGSASHAPACLKMC
jgi:hypothetical protein